MSSRVKCPMHGQDLELTQKPDGTKVAICICNTQGSYNKHNGKAVVIVYPSAEVEKPEVVIKKEEKGVK